MIHVVVMRWFQAVTTCLSGGRRRESRRGKKKHAVHEVVPKRRKSQEEELCVVFDVRRRASAFTLHSQLVNSDNSQLLLSRLRDAEGEMGVERESDA